MIGSGPTGKTELTKYGVQAFFFHIIGDFNVDTFVLNFRSILTLLSLSKC